MRQVATQSFTACMQVFVFFAVGSKSQVRQVATVDLLVGNRNVKAITELFQRSFVHFLGLVSNVLTFAGCTHAVTFNGFSQNDSRFAVGVVHCAVVSVVHFLRVMTTTVQCPNFVISHIGDQCFQFRRIEEVFANVCTVFGFVSLVVTVQALFHTFAQDAIFVFCQEAVPTTTPDDFHNIPAGAGKVAFQLLNDFAVTAYWTVQTLQVTVDDEYQVIQAFA